MQINKYCRFVVNWVAICVTGCSNNSNQHNIDTESKMQNLASVNWQDSVINLGTIPKDSTQMLVFRAKNTGKYPLLFQKIESTCGCTLLEQKINKPVMPGNTDSIVARFRITEDLGYVERKIYVLANTQQQFYVLRIRATVH